MEVFEVKTLIGDCPTCPTRVRHVSYTCKAHVFTHELLEVWSALSSSWGWLLELSTNGELSFFGYILFVGSYRWCLPIIVSPTFSMPPLLHLQLMKVLQPIVIIFSFSYDEIRVKWGQLYERFRGDVFYNARE